MSYGENGLYINMHVYGVRGQRVAVVVSSSDRRRRRMRRTRGRVG